VALIQDILHNQQFLGAFQDFVTVQPQPVLQASFWSGINVQTGRSYTENGGIGDTNMGRLRLQSGTNANGLARFLTRRPICYRPGQGMNIRFTPSWASFAEGSIQIWGIGSQDDGYFFGYNGSEFGIMHRARGNDVWVGNSEWNGRKLIDNGDSGGPFEWHKHFGSPVMIRYPYLGHGNILFWVQHQDSSRWVLVHTIKYTNNNSLPQVGNPNLFFFGEVKNAGNTSNLTAFCASVAGFISGEWNYLSYPKWTASAEKSNVTSETNLLSIRNATSYNGVTNTALIRMTSVTLASSGNAGISTLRLIVEPTLGGTPAFSAINGTTANNGATITNGNSTASIDTAGTTIAGGRRLYTIVMDNPGTQARDLIPEYIFVMPGETVTWSIESDSSAKVKLAVNWAEDT